MGKLSNFEGSIEKAFDNASATVFKGSLDPARLAHQAEKEMRREKLVGTDKQHAPTLYTILVSPSDDTHLFAYFPTMAAEIESYLLSHGSDAGLDFDCRPLVRFIVDSKLKRGKFAVIAEHAAAPIIKELRAEEDEHYGLEPAISKKAQDLVASLVEQENVREPREPREPRPRFRPQPEPEAGSRYDSDRVRPVPTSPPPVADELQAALREAQSLPLIEPILAVPGDDEPEYFGLDRQPLAPVMPWPDDFAGQPEATSLRTEPAIGERAWLTNVGTGVTYVLGYREVSIGRGSENDIILNDANVSRQHSLVHQDTLGSWYFVDLESTNGSLLNGRLASQVILQNGDLLGIGMTILEFQSDEA
ncbi:MAG: DUF3662 and FHA domain-containing protein [Coriobacteriia bacterium]|nr:DUF3662 and FHA domain-containing protein [Coriobacteriia bacterium]